MKKIVIHSLFALSLAACNVVEPNEAEIPAYLGDSGAPVYFLVPDSVERGISFQIDFAYWGSSTCTRLSRVERVITGQVAFLRPVIAEPRDAICTADLRRFLAATSITIDVVGSVSVQLRGRFGQRDTAITRQVWVR